MVALQHTSVPSKDSAGGSGRSRRFRAGIAMLGAAALATAGAAFGAGTAAAATATLTQSDIAGPCTAAAGFCTDTSGSSGTATNGTAVIKGTAGSGYLELSTPAAADAVQVFNLDQAGKNLNTLTALQYNSLVTTQATINPGVAPAFKIAVNPGKAANGVTKGFTTLVWEPVYSPTPSVPGVQKSFNPFTAASGWYATSSTLGVTPYTSSFANLVQDLPNATILAVGVGQGTGNAALVAQVNSLTINDTAYTFGNTPAASVKTYGVSGTATRSGGTSTAFGPGSLKATVGSTGFTDGALTLPDINIPNYRLFGVLPTSVQARVVPAAPVTGTISGTTLTVTSSVNLAIDQISVFGVPLLTPGSTCQTVTPSTVTLTGNPGVLQNGGSLSGGTYTAAKFSNCRLFGFFLEPLLNANVSGIPNAITANLGPPTATQ